MLQSVYILFTLLLISSTVNHSNGFRLKSSSTASNSRGIHYAYSIDDQNGNVQSKQESIHNDGSYTGVYKTLLPDGRLQIVTYVADKNGFRPKVRYEIPQTVTEDTPLETNQPQEKPIKVNEENDELLNQTKATSYSYSVNDNRGNEQSKQETITGNTVKGEYMVLLPDGRRQVVTYKADKNKFEPIVRYFVRKTNDQVQPQQEKVVNEEKIAINTLKKLGVSTDDQTSPKLADILTETEVTRTVPEQKVLDETSNEEESVPPSYSHQSITDNEQH